MPVIIHLTNNKLCILITNYSVGNAFMVSFSFMGCHCYRWDAVIVRPNIDGASVKGQAWIKSLRQKLAILSEHYNTTLHLARGGVVG